MRWSPRERWCLAATALPIAARNESHEWLGGAPRLVAHRDAARARLAEAELASTTALQKALSADRVADLVREHGEEMRDALIAYDDVTSLDLLGQGFLAGFLDEKFVWKRAFEIAAPLQKNFSSWESLGESYLVGKELIEGDIEEEDRSAFDALNDLPTSPWRRVAFDDFTEGARSVPANHPRVAPSSVVVVDVPKRMWTLSPAQRRAQAVWAVIAFTDHGSMSRLGGWPRTDGFIRGTRAGLKSHRIDDRDDLLRTLTQHRERSSARDRSTAHAAAWGVTFANWGFLVGFLNEDEAWKWIFDFAEDQIAACPSWTAFAEQLIEREKELKTSSLAMHSAGVERLLADANSPWRSETNLECVTMELSLSCPSCAVEMSIAKISDDKICSGCGEVITLDEAWCEYLLARDAQFSPRVAEHEKISRLDLDVRGRSRRQTWRGAVACIGCAAPLVIPSSKRDFACDACGLPHHFLEANSRVHAIDSDAVGLLEASFPPVPPATIACGSCGAPVVVAAGDRSAPCAKCKNENILPTRIFKAQTHPARLHIVRARRAEPLDLPGPRFQSLTLGDCPPMTAADALDAEGGDRAVVNDSPWKAFARTAADRFALALVALDTHFARANFSLLGGRLRTSGAARDARKRLRELWAVTSREQLLERLTIWCDVGVRSEFAAYTKWLAENPGDWSAEQLSGGDADKQRKWALILELDQESRGRGIAALDATWVIGSAGDGYLAGWISDVEAWDLIRRIARVVQGAYASWEEFVAQQFAGRRFVGMNVNGEQRARAQTLLADHAGPFHRAAWSTDLDDSKRAEENIESIAAWSVRLGVECSECHLPTPALSTRETSTCTACGKNRQIVMRDACSVLRSALARAEQSEPEKNARVTCIDVRSADTFHVDLRLADAHCPWCHVALDAKALRALTKKAAPCAACRSKLTLTRASELPELDQVHPRLFAMLEAEPREPETKKNFACAGCGAGLELHDAFVADCAQCGARNFLGDAAAAKIYGRTAPREALLLLGIEHTSPLPKSADAWKHASPMLANGEALLTEGER